mgnify:FL=1
MAKTKTTASPEATPIVPIKISRTAGGQLLEVATDKRDIGGLTPAARMELQEAGMLEQYTPPIREDQTLEWQINKNREALAKLAHWAKNACPKDPFKGGPLGGYKNGYEHGSHRKHPAAAAWEEIAKPTEYKACLQTRISEKGWQWLAGMGIVKPSEEDQGKPCARG